ncbi:hypothetical protein BATDEDRAFT_85437 [Batrachochytrium dendrobatidis JAM81]|uniref:Uncharacterized protein n=2 Tax=Batrachochytrium dendrobatidis TaxID=109871 RepID=F4NVH5_BATDJ|nr:uncharacterized protein BATDEDRAFT_85437 [Batrachochytrium dendrobatidis JAM81]EGF84096.1 hypothetical protein BATDEDRAFT_85437 [Batrachochytrium dendrobatidis JAM81]OAJ36593.1 hypothetical protein BDEG_20755 [Batrachochytrium dendrobatidis JEL423]|eukprot:XP_006676331.1 hypothetical protein BATDEDRAFT_85437 [Batrachochytrium dendrobatidis JAM81]
MAAVINIKSTLQKRSLRTYAAPTPQMLEMSNYGKLLPPHPAQANVMPIGPTPIVNMVPVVQHGYKKRRRRFYNRSHFIQHPLHAPPTVIPPPMIDQYPPGGIAPQFLHKSSYAAPPASYLQHQLHRV